MDRIDLSGPMPESADDCQLEMDELSADIDAISDRLQIHFNDEDMGADWARRASTARAVMRKRWSRLKAHRKKLLKEPPRDDEVTRKLANMALNVKQAQDSAQFNKKRFTALRQWCIDMFPEHCHEIEDAAISITNRLGGESE